MEIDNFSFALQTYYSGVNTTPENERVKALSGRIKLLYVIALRNSVKSQSIVETSS